MCFWFELDSLYPFLADILDLFPKTLSLGEKFSNKEKSTIISIGKIILCFTIQVSLLEKIAGKWNLVLFK